jgi:hypothetical protein
MPLSGTRLRGEWWEIARSLETGIPWRGRSYEPAATPFLIGILDHLGSSWIILATLSPESSATIPTLSWSKDRGVVSCCVNVLEPSPQVVPGGMISCIPHCTSVCHTVTVYARLPLPLPDLTRSYPILPSLPPKIQWALDPFTGGKYLCQGLPP